MNLANFILFVNSKCGISTIKYKGKFVKRGINAVTCRTNTSKKPGMRPVFACRRKKLQNIVNLAYRLAVFAAGPDRFLKACAFVSVFRHLFGNGLDLRGCQIAVGFCLRGQQFFLFFVASLSSAQSRRWSLAPASAAQTKMTAGTRAAAASR